MFEGIFYLAIFGGFIAWIAALVDVLKSEFRGQNDKLIWILVVLIVGIFGAIIYFIVGRKQKLYGR